MDEKSGNTKVVTILIVMILICYGLTIIMHSIIDPNFAAAESTWNQTSENDFKNGTFENTFINGTGGSADLQIETSGISRWSDKTLTPRPTSYPEDRFGHGMVSIPINNTVLLFGGRDNANWFNDTWLYYPNNNTWVDQNAPNGPNFKNRFQIASTYTDDKVVIFGGYHPEDENQTWVYDISNNTWEDKTPTNSTPTNNPEERYGFAMASIWGTDKVLLFSGAFGATKFDDLWLFDTSTYKWTEISPPSTRPYARNGPIMAAIDGTDKFVMYGGENTNETWLYDYGDNKWTEMVKLPVKLRGTGITTIYKTDKVMLFGGYLGPISSTVLTNQTWIFDYDDGPTGSWTNYTGSTSPSPRTGHTITGINNTNKVVLFGGYIGVAPWSSDETWMFDFKSLTGNGTYTSIPYDTGSNSTFNSISWFAQIPSGTSLRFQLRTALDQENLSKEMFLGPDGSALTFYSIPDETIWPEHYGDRWVQYKVYFNRTIANFTPVLYEVTISYNCIPNTKALYPGNESILSTDKPTFEWDFVDYDSITQQAFQVLIDDDANFTTVNYDSGQQSLSIQQWQFPTGTSYTTIPEGVWFWKVCTQDADGAWSKFCHGRKFIIDTQIPTSEFTLPVDNGFYNNLDIIVGTAVDAESGSGIEKVEIALKRLSDNYYWGGTSWTTEVNWLLAKGSSEWTYDTNAVWWTSGGQYNIQSRATDFANLVELPNSGITITMDMDEPISNIEIPPKNLWVNKVDSISGNASDSGGGGVSKVEIGIRQAGTSSYWDNTQWSLGEKWLEANGNNEWTLNTSEVEWLTGNEYVIKSRAIDYSGNEESPSSGSSFKYDAIAPKELGVVINNGDLYTNSTMVVLSVQGTDVGSGISEMSFSSDALNWTPWEMFESIKTFELPKDDGEKIVYFRLRDYAGNIAEPAFDQITLDTTPPEEVSIIINDNAEFTNSDVLSLTINAVDTGSGLYSIALSFNSLTWHSWEPFKNTRTLTVSVGTPDGEIRVYVKVSDLAGNIAEPVFDLIILDTTPPEELSMVVKGTTIEMDTILVMLELEATDAHSGVAQMAFSTDADTWTSWEPFANERILTLPSMDGEMRVYFKVSDIAGNIADPISKSILSNITPDDQEPGGESDGNNERENFMGFLLMIAGIAIIIIIIITWLTVVRKRRKRAEQKVMSEATTVKPRRTEASVLTSSDQVSGAPTLEPQLPQLPQPASGVMETKVPTLAPTQAPQQISAQVTAPAPVPQVVPAPMMPKLPPAKTEEIKEEGGEVGEIVQEPTPTVATPGDEPIVNLPDEQNADETSEKDTNPQKQTE